MYKRINSRDPEIPSYRTREDCFGTRIGNIVNPLPSLAHTLLKETPWA